MLRVNIFFTFIGFTLQAMKGPFEIYELTEEVVSGVAANPVPLHRHNFEEFLVILQGAIVHQIDLQRDELTAPVIVYVAEGKVHQFIPGINARGWVIKYRSEFLPDSRFNFFSFFSDKVNYGIDSNFCISNLHQLCEMIRQEYTQNEPDYNILRHLLRAALSKLENEASEQFSRTEGNNAQTSAFNTFLKILNYNYNRAEGVQFYADKMNTSVRNLNLICTNVFGKPVSEIIETRKLIEARRLLLNSDKNIAEIGDEVGYPEKSYFTRVFKRKTGLTPSEYRAQMTYLVT
jgi:AraC-like DNA-binding protein